MELLLKRAYLPASPTDGYRVLVDRLWPRGLSKEEARLDEWNKDLAPSSELRRWFGHDPIPSASVISQSCSRAMPAKPS